MGAFDDLTPASRATPGPFDDLIPANQLERSLTMERYGQFADLVPARTRTWGEAAADTGIDLAKGVVGLGEGVVGLTDLLTGNVSGQGWAGLGYDPERTKQILGEFYSDARKDANRNVAEAKGFVDTTKAMLQNPSAAVGSMVESSPLMLGGAAAVRSVASKMLAARGLVAGTEEAAAFLARPEVLARLTAVGSAAEGALTSGGIQEQGRQAGRDYLDTAPEALNAGAITAAIGFWSSKIPGFHDSEVGAAIAGMSGKQRQSLLASGKEIAKGMFKEGILEELPQSAQEQVWTNLALGKPWDQGVAEAAAQGMVAGAGMGGGMNAYSAGRNGLARAAHPGKPNDRGAAADTGPAPVAVPDVVSKSADAIEKPAQVLVNRAQQATENVAEQAAPGVRPEVRLAELELTSEHRSLTDQEKVEVQQLARTVQDDQSAQPQADASNLDRLEATPAKAPAPRPYWDGFQSGDRVQTSHGTTGTLEIAPDKHLAYLVHDTNADGTPNTEGGKFSVTPQEVTKIQVKPRPYLMQSAKPPTDFWVFASELGYKPADLRIGTEEWQHVKNEFEMAKVGLSMDTPAQPAPTTRGEIQNRDRARAASVAQMMDIAKNPDYMRLGTSRTPDSGAPMVFPVGDDFKNIRRESMGHSDTAVMADGQRVPFVYAVVPAHSVKASHYASGVVNDSYDSTEPGTLKALNNGRTAGIQHAYLRGSAKNYRAELLQDAQAHGVSVQAIRNTLNPMLIRAYLDSSNTADMGAKSQAQGLGLAPGELARQDAPLLDATVLTTYRPGDITSAANRDFVRAFIGKLRHHGQDVAGMMTADGTLSPAGRTRIQAALVQAAYGDADLVNEMFDSQDSHIKGIGTALKTVAGRWADMRDSARMGAIDEQVDITGNLVQAINLIRKSRQEGTALNDLVNQVDLLTGQALDPLTIGLLRFFYRGHKYLSMPLSTEKVVAKFNAYLQAAMGTSTSVGMFDDAVTVERIIESITGEANDTQETTHPTQDLLTGTDSRGNRGLDPGEGRAEQPGSSSDQGGQEPGGTGQIARAVQAVSQEVKGAAQEIASLGESGTPVLQALAEQGMSESTLDPETKRLLNFLETHADQPAKVDAFLGALEEAVATETQTQERTRQDASRSTDTATAENTERGDPAKNTKADSETQGGQSHAPGSGGRDQGLGATGRDQRQRGQPTAAGEVGGPTKDASQKTGGARKETGQGVALFQADEGGYSAGHEPSPIADNSAESTQAIGMLERGVARAPGGTGADSVHPYEARRLPGHEQISQIAAAFGDTIQGFGLRSDLSPEQLRQYGFFNGAYLKGTIFLRDQGQDRPHLAILGHEMAHRMKATQPQLYEQLVKAIGPYIDSKRYGTEFRESSVARYVTTEAGVMEEFVGEVLSDGFMEKKFWQAIGNSNPSLLRKVVDFVSRLIDTIRAAVGYNRRTAHILTDFDRVMEIAGEVMGKYGQIRTATNQASDTPLFNRNSLGEDPVPLPAGAQANVWTVAKNRVMRLTSPENLDKLVYEFQDKFIDLKRIQDRIKELGGTVTDLNDAYLGEELFHKRLAKRTEDFLADELKPLLEGLKAKGITLDQLEKYLHARHAPEANKALAERNPNRAYLDQVKAKANAEVRALEMKLQRAEALGTSTKTIEASLVEARAEVAKWNGAQAFQGSEDKRLALSGMSDQEAADHMASLAPAQLKNLDSLAAQVDAINAKTLELLESYGLMDRAALNAWRSEYQYYVPLHRDEAQAESTSHPIGAGFSVKGNAAKSRTGSNEKVTHILGHIAMQREAALTRGEKNLVAKKLYLMAAQNPDESLWTVDKAPTIKTLDTRTGTVRLVVDPLFKTRPNVLMVRIAGKDVAIVFNENNAQGLRLVSAMKNLDVGDLHVVLGLASKATRWFASVNTQYNPIFGLINFGRDLQEGMVNLSTTPLQGKQLDIAKNVAAAMRAIYRTERGKGSVSPENKQWMDLWDGMQEVGGTTGYRDLYADAADRVKALEKELHAMDRGQVSQAAHAVVEWLSVYNEAMENAVRLSAYKVGLDNGMTKERAASLAKNLTVNFNRKGRQTREIGALYAFFNAAVQGTARMAETLKGPLGQRIMLGGVAIGAINALVGMALMGGGDGKDDEWERIPDFVKERSLIIPISRTQYVSIPMPLGFKLFPNIGRIAMETAFGGPKHTPGKAVGDTLSALVDTFNPLGGAQNLGQMAAPTVLDPVVALMQNKDWTGKPIYRENSNPLDPQPGSKLVRDSASAPGRLLAELINRVTGGTNYRPGAWSPTPDQIDYVFGQLTGGLGRELLKASQVVSSQFTGDDLPAYKIPLVSRLYGETTGPAAQSEQFYANVKALNEVRNELKGRARHGDAIEEFRKSEPLADLAGMGQAAEQVVSRLRAVRRATVEQGAPDYKERVKEIDRQIGEVMANFNREVDRAQRKAAAR